MKHVFLMRHAQAQIERYGQNDRERSITMDGMHEIESMRLKLRGKFSNVSLVLCSSVKRTRQTLQGVQPLLPSKVGFEYEEGLYQCSVNILWDKIHLCEEKHTSILIIAHNPSLTDFMLQLDPSFQVFPTCACISLSVQNKHWNFIEAGDFILGENIRP